jgi:lysophospholipase L1-like esterase
MTKRWIPTWTAAPMNVWAADGALSGFYNQTIREVARISVGGERLVLRFTNEFGAVPFRLDAVQVAMAGEGGASEPLTTRPVTFGGSRSATFHAGSPLFSDPIDLAVSPLSRVAVSCYSSGFIPVHTHHFEAQQTAFISTPGNFTAAEQMIVQQTTTSRYLLSAIYCETEESVGGVICVGDSITDGYGSSIDGDCRWPDILAERFQQHGLDSMAVVNLGIGGNRLLHNRRGQKLLERFDRDVASLSGMTHLVILEGINDIVWPHTVLAGADEEGSLDDIIGGLSQVIARARIAGLKVAVGTVTPFEGTMSEVPNSGYYTAGKERTRQAVNKWIRTQSGADLVFDFDETLRDPRHPSRLLAAFDCGDHIHPNDSGYRAMAEAIDPSWFN